MISVPRLPSAGLGFTTWGGGFESIVKQAHYGGSPRPGRIGLMCAGSDLNRGRDADAMAESMDELRHYWAA
jgi:hypothetical protein